jgi:hypothetical protein
MHMRNLKRAAPPRRLLALVLATACGLDLLLPAMVSTAMAVEPEGIEATTKRPVSHILPVRAVDDKRESGGVPGKEATPSQATASEKAAPGSEVVSAQALRALLTDPAVRAFVVTAEYAWDFTQPETIPGFGRLP